MQKMTVRRLLAMIGATAVMTLGLFTGAALGGAGVAQADPAAPHSVDYQCGSGYYENSDGGCTRSPDSSPTGIRCKDGTYSHAKTRQGACSHHGGIDDSSSGTGGGSSDEGTGSAVATGSAVFGSVALGSIALPMLLAGLLGSS